MRLLQKSTNGNEPSHMFGQLPLFIDGDVRLVQSGAIVRYLVKKFGMCCCSVTSVQDKFLCDQLYEGTDDIFNVCLTYRRYRGGTREALDKAVAEGEIIYNYLVRLVHLLNTYSVKCIIICTILVDNISG